MPGASGWSYDWGYHELETPDKWEYVTKDGTKLLLLLKLPNELAAESPYAIPSGEILADLDGCFVGMYVWGVDFDISSREALEALADQIDFSVF